MNDAIDKAKEALGLQRRTIKLFADIVAKLAPMPREAREQLEVIEEIYQRVMKGLAALEAEKPAENAVGVAENVFNSIGRGVWKFPDSDYAEAANIIQSYHKKECEKCIGSLPAFPHRPESFRRFEKRSGVTTDVIDEIDLEGAR